MKGQLGREAALPLFLGGMVATVKIHWKKGEEEATTKRWFSNKAMNVSRLMVVSREAKKKQPYETNK